MEKELRDRLTKVVDENPPSHDTEDDLFALTLATLHAIQAYQGECHPGRDGDAVVLDEAIEVILDYR